MSRPNSNRLDLLALVEAVSGTLVVLHKASVKVLAILLPAKHSTRHICEYVRIMIERVQIHRWGRTIAYCRG
jgi:hypothetical protein